MSDNIPAIQRHEIAEMRAAADRAPFDAQQKFHALLDAYEDTEDGVVKLGKFERERNALKETLKEITKLATVRLGTLDMEKLSERLGDIREIAARDS